MYFKIFTGPMFSGKTTNLVNFLNNNIEKKCLYVNHTFDTRGNDFSSHDQNLKLNETIKRQKCSNLKGINVEDYDIIGIDECQFFKDLYDFIISNNTFSGVIVVSGLYADINFSQFGSLVNCIPMADEINILYSNCYNCGIKCLHTRKINDYQQEEGHEGNEEINDKQVEIGGKNLYKPSCKKCFFL
jgi:thymidine kinase